MREIAGFIEVSPGFWIPKPRDPPAPAPEQKPVHQRSREEIASTLAAVGIAVDTSRATPTDIAEERKRKQREHEETLAKLQQLRDEAAQAQAKQDLDTLLPIKNGVVDNRFLEVLKGIWAKNHDGSVNYVFTLAERKKYLDEHQWRVERGLPTTPEGV